MENDKIVAYMQRVDFCSEAQPVGCQTSPWQGLDRIQISRDTPCVVGRHYDYLPLNVFSRDAFSVRLTPENTFMVELLSKTNGLFVRKYSCTSDKLEGWCPAMPTHLIENGDFIKLSETVECVPGERMAIFQLQIRPSQIQIRPAHKQELEVGHTKSARRRNRGHKVATTALFMVPSTDFSDSGFPQGPGNPYTL